MIKFVDKIVMTFPSNNSSPGSVLLDEPLEADDAAMDPGIALPVFRLDCEQRPLDRLQHQQWLLLSGIAEGIDFLHVLNISRGMTRPTTPSNCLTEQ